jgi:hypothetical protein
MTELDTTTILKLLRERPGSYIQQYFMGRYCMMDANGDAVTMEEDGKVFGVEPTAEQMGSLMAASHLVCHGSRYALPN